MKTTLSLILFFLLGSTALKAQYIRNVELLKAPSESGDSSCNAMVALAYLKSTGVKKVEVKLYSTNPTQSLSTATFTVNSTTDINTLLLDEGLYTPIPLGAFPCSNKLRAAIRILGDGDAELSSKIIEE
jgi:hypothetical protein